MTNQQRGNVFLYILIAVALFAGLTMVITRMQDNGELSVLSQGQVKTYAQRLTGYADQTSQAWLQMKGAGENLGGVSFMLPTDGSFNSAPTIHKLFHPDGGGLQYNAMNEDTFRASSTTPVGWSFTLVNADWTATSGTDFLLTYMRLKQSICAEINRKITGSTTIPAVTVNFTDTFVDGTTPLAEADCAECKTYPSICVQNGGVYAFYNLIDVR